MEFETEEIALEKCKSKIEQQLGWGDSSRWHTTDYETLSNRIHEKTGVTLSVATLKRLWGKIRYDSKPTPTTLNTLAQYLGYESWRSFRVSEEANRLKHVHVAEQHPHKKPTGRRWAIAATITVAAAIGSWFFIQARRSPAKLNPDLFSFSSKKVVDIGVPNTVVFDYDAAAALPTDSIFIQQSWDKRLSRQVRQDQKQHTSIYYIPGFFEAKLVINGQIIKEHNLLIQTNGWLPLVEQPGSPVYFKKEDAIHDGIMQLPIGKIAATNIQIQPVAPWTHYYIVGKEFEGLISNDVVFETALKNDYNDGSNPCQYAEIRIQFEGPVVLIPITAKGCVHHIAFGNTDGSKQDFSKLGVDFSDWINIRCVIQDKIAEVFVNGESAVKLRITFGGRGKMVEIGYRFQGTGSVDFVKVSNNAGKVFYDEDFGK